MSIIPGTLPIVEKPETHYMVNGVLLKRYAKI
jgi:hypothetical protein